MASTGIDATYGTPTWTNTQAPDFGPDLSEAARAAARFGNFRVGTTAERNAASGGAARAGVYWSDTTDGELYRRAGGTWNLVPMARVVFGHAGKTAGFQSMSGGVVATVTLQDSAGGMTLNDNGLIIPVTGRYQVNARFYFSGPGAGMVRGDINVNGTMRASSRTYKQVVAGGDPPEDVTASLSQIMLLAAGDKLQLWSNYGNSTWGTDGYNGTYIEALRVA